MKPKRIISALSKPSLGPYLDASPPRLACDLLDAVCLVMNSNRIRLWRGSRRLHRRFAFSGGFKPLDIKSIPAPEPIAKPSPEQIVQDILLSTLDRIKRDASPEMAAAAARFAVLVASGSL